MLPLHYREWGQCSKSQVCFNLIDDGSPTPIPVPSKMPHVEVYRIKQDIPWNIAGARNLAFFAAKTDWVLCADIDHIVTPEVVRQILSLDLSDPNTVYKFRRVSESDGYVGCEAIINILMNRKRFFQIGGYDEDFSGNYGREETFFRHCLQKSGINLVQCDHISLSWHPRFGATRGLKRDKTVNGKIFERKMADLKQGTYKNGPILRFEWDFLDSQKS